MLNAELILTQINPDTMPDAGPPVVLPGGETRGTVSPKQERLYARYAKANYPGLLTWAQAVAKMRSEFLVGAQKDFGMTEKVLEKLREVNVENPMSAAQTKMTADIISALTGEKDHWDPEINRKIKASPKPVRDSVLVQFVDANKQGQLTVAMAKFSALYGKPQPRAGLGEPFSTGSVEVPNDPSSLYGDDVNPDDDPDKPF
jgi:hypothetical protein